jgi:FAD/FMN-containing dehydrogenase
MAEEKELAKIVGSSHVLGGVAVLDDYSRDLSFTPRMVPRCVVRPGSVEEVQGVVKWANHTLAPLVPVSSGAPHFRGDTVPGAGGAVIVDLSRMKRIIRVDPRNKVAMVEPGVTFAELQAALEKEGLSAYMPLAPRGSKSVIGSVLEREPITMPGHHWDSTDPLLCAEVVFGTGDKFRTGEASGPDTVEEQWELGRVQMNPFGHSHVDFQRLLSGAQGTIGIVTWATLKCHYRPELKRAFLVPSPSIEPLIELSYRLVRYRLGASLFILNGLNLACLLGQESGEVEKLNRILPPWVLFISFEGYGVLPEEKVAYEEADFRAMARSAKLKPAADIPGASAEEVLARLAPPSPRPYWKLRFKGGFQDIFFLTTLDKAADFISAMAELVPPENTGVYLQPIVQGTGCHCEFNLYYDPAEPAEVDVVRRLVRLGGEEMARRGGFFSRPYGVWRDIAYRRAEGTRNMQRKVKGIFDPNGILNPGKLCFEVKP